VSSGELRRIRDAQVTARSVLVRVDYNVPLRGGEITDDSRIRASKTTLDLLLSRRAKIVLVTHLGRPDGKTDPALRLDAVAARLADVIRRPVTKLDDCIGPKVERRISAGRTGDVFLLENVRFHPEEEANDEAFARQLAGLADVYVNDAFATVHRAHASTYGVAKLLPAYAGCLMEREIDALSRLIEDPARPYVAVVGGKKAESKLGALRDLTDRVDRILIGGGVAFSFLAAQGARVGDSVVDEGVFDEIREIADAARARGVEIDLPVDVQIARKLATGEETSTASAADIPGGWAGFDIGPKTAERFRRQLLDARSIVWTGPMGAYEVEPFSAGTLSVAQAVADAGAFSVVGGGETGEAVTELGFADKVSYISTGGGACLALLRGKTLPALEALRDS
jgi:phosphoglycerate kinase